MLEPSSETPSLASDLPVNYADVEAAAGCLAGLAHRTPVLSSRQINDRTGCTVFFKCENFQRTGSFKFRGAYNALAQLPEAHKRAGALTYSSGNHAQAVALAGRLLQIRTTVIMPDDAPPVKIAATRGYGAEIVLYNRAETTREALGAQLARERNLTIIPPYDHAHVVAGQGTAARELIEETGPLDHLLVCCGGGGLLSGSALSAHALSPGCRVIGVEPEQADDATRSFRTGTLHTVHNPDTVADGARTPSLGNITFPVILRYVHEMLTVPEKAILRSMFYLWERMKIVVEPTGALAPAALLEGMLQEKNARIGVVISGGNVDVGHIPRYLAMLQA